MSLMMFFPVGGVLFAYAFKWLANWQNTLAILVTGPSLLLNLPSFLLLKETPMFLNAHGYSQRLKATLLAISRINKREHLLPKNYIVI